MENLAPLIAFGASPRATIYLAQAAKAFAFIDGRGYVTPEDVKAVAKDILRHRLIVTYEAEAEGPTSDDIVERTTGRRGALGLFADNPRDISEAAVERDDRLVVVRWRMSRANRVDYRKPGKVDKDIQSNRCSSVCGRISIPGMARMRTKAPSALRRDLLSVWTS